MTETKVDYTEEILLTTTEAPPAPPPEEKKFPWEWLAIGGAGLLALVLLAKPEKK